MIAKPKLDHPTILYSDREASEAFYRAVLPLVGFQETASGIWSDGEGFHLQFMKAKAGTRPYERYGAGLNHWGFGMGSEEDVHALRAGLLATGIDAQPVQDLGGAQALFVPDPDGLRLEFTWYPDGVAVVG